MDRVPTTNDSGPTIDHEGPVIQTAQMRERGIKPWWLRDIPREYNPERYSWVEVFERDEFKCVYCRNPLDRSSAEVATSTIDHIVPRKLFSPRGAASRGSNLAACCPQCNSLKSDWHPEFNSPVWDSRSAFIEAVRRQIEFAARERDKTYAARVGSSDNPKDSNAYDRTIRTYVEQDREDYRKSKHVDLSFLTRARVADYSGHLILPGCD